MNHLSSAFSLGKSLRVHINLNAWLQSTPSPAEHNKCFTTLGLLAHVFWGYVLERFKKKNEIAALFSIAYVFQWRGWAKYSTMEFGNLWKLLKYKNKGWQLGKKRWKYYRLVRLLGHSSIVSNKWWIKCSRNLLKKWFTLENALFGTRRL